MLGESELEECWVPLHLAAGRGEHWATELGEHSANRLGESELEECRAPLRLAVGLGDPYLGEHSAHRLEELVLEECLPC